jgi:hypothetical protein
MKVDRAKAITRPAGGDQTAYLCSAHCAAEFDRANRAAGREHPRPAAR